MTEKLTQETIEDLVLTAHKQAHYLIESMLRQAVSDFEGSDSEDFKLALTIEGQRKRGGGTLTLQTRGQSSVDLKRKDQTPAATIDYGPTLPFDKEESGLPEDAPEKTADGSPRLLKPAPLLLKAAEGVEVVDGEEPGDDGDDDDVPEED